MMQGKSTVRVARRDGHHRSQRYRSEMAAAIRRLLHGASGGIRVVRDDHAVAGGNMEIAEQVALGERGDEHLLGIPSIGIAVENAVGRPADLMLSCSAHDMIAPVCPVIARSGSAVSGPFERDGEVMFVIHPLNATPWRR